MIQPFNDEYFMKQALIEARAQLSTIVYGASDIKRGFQEYAPKALHPKAIVRKGILEKECAEEMKRFFKGKR